MSKKLFGGAVLWLLLWWPAAAHADPNSSPFGRTDPGAAGVEYEGTLICFRRDVDPSHEDLARCKQEGHAPLLRRADGHIHKLTGSTNSITAKLASDELHGKKVKVKGIYYPKANQVLVEKLIPLEH